MLQLRPVKLVISSLLHRGDEKHRRRRVAIFGLNNNVSASMLFLINVAGSAGSVVPPELSALDSNH